MLKRFSEISMKDVSTCGGKGASLGEMMDAGLPIPNGFVLTTNAYGKESNERENDVLQAFDKLDTKFVAVRSSGTKEDGVDDSFAGQFDTYLFVTRENLIEKIKECHDSVNSERIISYCDYKGIDRKSIKVAVVVQKMVNSDSAGVCFTVNPVSQNYDEIMIDAGYGVGEAVVSGMITPDNYIVNKKTCEIKKVISRQEKKLVLSDKGGTEEIDIPVNEQSKQKLSDENIKKLSGLAKKIEKHYGKPMDTEWAVENGELFMLQARPITTLRNKNSGLSSDFDLTNYQPELWKNSQIYYNYQGFPFFTSIFKLCSSLEESRYSTPILYISKYTDDNKIVSYLSGDFIGKGYNMINDLLDQKDDALKFLAKKNDLVENCIKNCEKYIDKNSYDFFNIWNDIQISFAEGRYVCNISYALQDYLDKLKESDHKLFECLQLNISPREETFLNKAEKYLIDLVDKNPNDFDIVYKKFMDKFYWFQNSYLGVKTITKEWLFSYYKTLVNKEHENNVEAKKSELPNKYKLLIQTASDAIIYQDNRKKLGLIVNVIMDRWLKDISKQTNIPYDDLVWLTVDEIKNYDISTEKGIIDLKDKIFSYKKSGKRFWILTKNIYIDTDENLWSKVIDLNAGNGDSLVIKGAIGNKGKYVGKAKIILNIDKDGENLETGDILVTGMTRPEFLPLMQRAGAFITDEGGITCHAAIVSRELGKPCIIGTKIATKVLKDGDLVEVDADSGVVKILKNGEKDNLNLEILGKTYTPEFWQNPEIFFNYQGVPFYTSVFAKCYSLPESTRSTPAYYISEFREGGTIIQYCTGNFVEKGYNVINDLLEGKTHGSEFLAENDRKIVDCFEECKKYINLGKTNFIDIWRQIENAYADGWHIFNFSHALQDYLNKLMGNDISLYQILSNGIIAPEKTFINKAGDYLKKLVEKYPNDFDVIYENFMKEYGRFQNSYLGVNKNITKEWLKNYYESLLERKDNEFEKASVTNIPEKYKSLVDVAGKAIIYQDNKKRLGLIAYEIMDKRLQSISMKISIPFEDLLWLTVDEILSYNLDSKDSINGLKEKISKYKKSGVRYGIMIDTGYIDVDKEFWDKVVEINSMKSELKEIKGIVGNKGKIVGRAKIVLSIKKDGNKLESGDILVTGMTRPEFLPLMQKAGAFVTDEGGITCHAAIVSRELGKPCIIGTKIATQVLKDGDLIEVDADNGIVKIL